MMNQRILRHLTDRCQSATSSLLIASACVCIAAGCGSPEPETSTGAAPAVAPSSGFGTPEAAFVALADAARSRSNAVMRTVLGVDSDAMLDAGDPVHFEAELDNFVALYEERNAVVENESGGYTLVIGQDGWPFPIPVVGEGQNWVFDVERGREEIANRRVGRNELNAIQVCRAIADAQEEYRAMNPEGNGAYAQKFFSDPGKKNGLFWPGEEGTSESPLGALVADAAAEGYERGTEEEPAPYYGYHYRIVTGQGEFAPGGARTYIVDGAMTGGFAVVAWPAEYGRSGVMTFLINHLGVVYETDLGEETAEIAAELSAFDPGPDWRVCQDVNLDSVANTMPAL